MQSPEKCLAADPPAGFVQLQTVQLKHAMLVANEMTLPNAAASEPIAEIFLVASR